MARLRFCFESHLLVILCHNSPKKSLCLFAYAFSSFCVGHSPGVVFFTVFAKSDLPNNTFKQVLDIMMKSSWGLNELAVKHNSTGPSLWMERKGRWVETDIFSSYVLAGKKWVSLKRKCLQHQRALLHSSKLYLQSWFCPLTFHSFVVVCSEISLDQQCWL